jgi:hypothetical protein
MTVTEKSDSHASDTILRGIRTFSKRKGQWQLVTWVTILLENNILSSE